MESLRSESFALLQVSTAPSGQVPPEADSGATPPSTVSACGGQDFDSCEKQRKVEEKLAKTVCAQAPCLHVPPV